ncbi:hypothetical protein NIES2135_42550 [Leptolyngbya boryana NIES-2135]|jgi:hypothetical protein|uniref:DUF4242 domain-containing protein n=1 Tax=Leptolyngbya boryana NIES-2135 TaxID=1973484 RepID=A0A1Z4JKZ8_LEPBY|nr:MULTISPECIES: nickel-binding protein [Leptolyngbya]BAY57390.1 hypothetical protein NIES2135_42550 [Leptolyngbya boryana NIES-2135]MBD2368670.1 DUF4242 domain-containing protein [Leptolyngbya sp. FACHB-161]MBD2375069.1 DUF4242 domain-containing protein [Leptolyngbya sp. FACHB-238]MBD2399488.1 DUF4242 domain-containing protein [Leptolyngbya sp. FACHB-239]MBD2405694.1 DUF4242 domain-containing protein [Leptolyngbya sp. FACHB-402]
MSLVIVETVAEQPLTDAYLEEAVEIALPCLQARGITWLHSLLSRDRAQMICLYDSPDAATVRNAYAHLGVQKRAIWSGEMIPNRSRPQPNSADRSVIEAHSPASSAPDWNRIHQQFSQCCRELGVNWLRSYLSLDRTSAVYELEGLDAETIRNVSRKLGTSFDRIWSAHLLMP